VTLRRADASDRPRVEALQHRAYAKNRPILGVEPMPLLADYGEIFATMEVWLDEDGARLMGVLILEPRADDLLIWSIATDPDFPATGRGRALLVAAEARARDLGRRLVRLYTGKKLTERVAWYARHGYDIEREETVTGREIVHMRKLLQP
jgi:GNAT superfamily N-acetyltransferase